MKQKNRQEIASFHHWSCSNNEHDTALNSMLTFFVIHKKCKSWILQFEHQKLITVKGSLIEIMSQFCLQQSTD